MLISNFFLINNGQWFKTLLFAQISFYVIPFLDLILSKFGCNLKKVRFISHWLAMNLALFMGFIAFLRGIKSNVWLPTKRHQ
jgi:hypothetical protein